MKRLLRNSFLTLLMVCSAGTLVSYAQAPAGQKNATSVADFTYTSQNKRDPFEPVYMAKATKDGTSNVPKSGYELEELKLVGVLKTGLIRFAMMEDMQGKGLLFKKGDFINNNTWVTEILDDKIILAYKLKGDTRSISIDIPRK